MMRIRKGPKRTRKRERAHTRSGGRWGETPAQADPFLPISRPSLLRVFAFSSVLPRLSESKDGDRRNR